MARSSVAAWAAIAIAGASCLLAAPPTRSVAADNTLSDQERREGWQLLFDGKTTDGWMWADQRPVAASHVQDGALNPHPREFDALILHKEPVESFVLALDFKITPKCNSGVFVRVWPLEARPGLNVAYNGLEIAIDDTATADFHDTGAIYDLVKPKLNAMKPVGQWNHLEVTCDRSTIKAVLNEQPVSQMNMDEWTTPNQRPDGTRHKFDVAYKDHPRRGYIGLQDHGSDVWYRNIELRRIE